MGFGLLLIGYIFAFVAELGYGPYIFGGMLVGGTIMFIALCELRKYSPTFLYAIIANTLFLICGIYEAVAWAEGMFAFSIGFSQISLYFDWIEFAVKLIFNLTMLYGIFDLSKRVGFQPTLEKSIKNMIFVVIYNVGYVFYGIWSTELLGVLTIILQLLYSVLNAYLIFKCYAMICPEGQEDMPRKRSRFEFINKIRDKQDERDEQALASSKAYIESKLKKQNEKKPVQHHGKKWKKKK